MTDSVSQKTKKCPGCDKVKSFDEYHINTRRKDGRCFYCIVCHTEKNKAYNKKNYNPEIAKAKHLFRTYGITSEQYTQMLKRQNGVCACCKRAETIFSNKANAEFQLAVDHNHDTGEVRALLCMTCNTALGALEESPERIEALLAYVYKLQGV